MKAPDHCSAFVDVHGMITCEPAALKAFIKAAGDRYVFLKNYILANY